MRFSPQGAAFLAVAVLAAGCASLPGKAEEGTVLARLVAGESALPGAEITAVMNPGIEFRERVHTSVAGEDATALLSLPPGSWYLSARSAEGSVFGFYGPNPVQIRSGEEVPVSIRGLAGNRPPSVETADGKGGIEGRVATTGGPLEGAVVAFYLDASSQFRGPGYVEVTTDRDGLFFSSVSPGRYFLVVRKRSGPGGGFGPLSVGDHFGYYGFNPVVLREGERIDLQMAAVEVLRRTGWEKPSSLRALLSGVVRDPGGAPLAGYRVFLHSRPGLLGKPDFVSDETGPDGAFEIWAERSGTFILGARKVIGQAREEGEIVGYYQGSPDHTVTVRMDGKEMIGVDVVVEEGAGE
jgi:hypothetical protein